MFNDFTGDILFSTADHANLLDIKLFCIYLLMFVSYYNEYHSLFQILLRTLHECIPQQNLSLKIQLVKPTLELKSP